MAVYSGIYTSLATVDTWSQIYSEVPFQWYTRQEYHWLLSDFGPFWYQSHRLEHVKETLFTVFRKFQESAWGSCLVIRGELTKIFRIRQFYHNTVGSLPQTTHRRAF